MRGFEFVSKIAGLTATTAQTIKKSVGGAGIRRAARKVSRNSVTLSAAFAFSAVFGTAAHANDTYSNDTSANNGSVSPNIPPIVNNGAPWRVVKPHWDEADEAGYAAFVTAIGSSNCKTLWECLRDPANPYRTSDQRSFSGDCADMAYILRAYYAWKNGLVFSYQSAMLTADGAREDLRYSTNGNKVAARRNAIGAAPISAPSFIGRIGGEVSTAMFRTHPDLGDRSLFDDFYPVAINRDAVRPGVIAYDIFGHVGIVYDVKRDGRVMIVASHPDNSVTRTVYGPNFMRSKPALGAGLKAWRPIHLHGATKAADGSYIGGTVRAAANEDIPDFSIEQYIGNAPHPTGDWRYGEFRFAGRMLTYYDYVRRKLAAPDFAYDPVDELRHGLRAICTDIKARKVAVDRAVAAKMPSKPHPARLPYNIYGAYGDWEAYSTPSRDARLKVSFIELRRTLEDNYRRTMAGDPAFTYSGDDLAGDLWDAFVEEKDACEIKYRKSDGVRVRLNLGHVMDRLFDLSFDPFHCPERRWGAQGAELDSCTDGPVKDKWYAAQRYLRNQAERTYDVRMDFTADELKAPMAATPAQGGLGVERPADADIRGLLTQLNGLDANAPQYVRQDAAYRP